LCPLAFQQPQDQLRAGQRQAYAAQLIGFGDDEARLDRSLD
jgi:hypothetical protein